MSILPSASYSLTPRCQIENSPGRLGQLTTAIGEAGGDIGAIDIVSADAERLVRDITAAARDEQHGQAIVERVNQVGGVQVVHVSDRAFLLHLGGKIEVTGKIPVKTRDDLSMAYTPGVARVCLAIAGDPDKVWNLTIKRNTVAIVTDGSAVLGLGNIGPRAAMPVMEGKALLFKEFAGVDAFPLCLDTQDTDEIVETVVRVAPDFGGINLEDIAAPRCFEIEARLQELLDIPIFHDDQHGSAIVTYAALVNALKVVGKELDEVRIVMMGAGAAGIATAKTLMAAGARDLIMCDSRGTIHAGRTDLNEEKAWIAANSNLDRVVGSVNEAVRGADVFIGLSVPDVLKPDAVRTMASDAIVFALANPRPEVQPEEVSDFVRVMATGRSDYPNQINNVLAFPGVFRGALDSRASRVNEEMNHAAALAIANVIGEDELTEDYIIPSVFNRSVSSAVAAAVAQAAYQTGVARREPNA
ncbi:MAG: NAD-dependent malic enzyme [Chloroflexi bacterium]|nr:NAD-dependent malic enzyme [Chloroflexota bacterium]